LLDEFYRLAYFIFITAIEEKHILMS